jgi:clan AA aspartic protease (TIGR02281 family)
MGVPRKLLFIAASAAVLASARTWAEGPAADDAMKARGLRRIDQVLVLSDETTVIKKFREIDALRKKVTASQQAAAAAEKKVDDKRMLLIDYAEKRRMLRAQMDNITSVKAHNRLVGMLNELVDRTIILEKSDKEEKDAAAARAAATTIAEQYIELLLQVRRQYDEVEAEYQRLADDSEMQRAIDELGQKSSKPCKLGPTNSFTRLDNTLKKLEAGVLSETIVLRRGDGNLWHVTATFNGKHAQDMAIDTGASIVSLPYQVAKDAGLAPSAQDPTVQMGMADGRVIEAKLVVAPSVRVGKFQVERVECAVLPENMPHAEPLLGLSFLKHFTFKIDSANGKLAIAKIDEMENRSQRPANRGASP